MKDYHLVFRIRTIYYDLIVKGEKRVEIRPLSRYWIPRARYAERARSINHRNRVVGVFVCGKRVHRREVTRITYHPSAFDALGREPSEQGKKDLGDGQVVKFWLGRKINS